MDSAPFPPAIFALSDGSVFYGQSLGAAAAAAGEVVFNTAMTGYQEILTDPSYDGQIINFTHPHIGNTGINAGDDEADAPRAKGIIARQIGTHYSNWRARESLPDFLRRRNIAAVSGVDTRAITRRLRAAGALGGCIVAAEDGDVAAAAARAAAEAKRFAAAGGLLGAALAQDAGRHLPRDWREGEWRADGDSYETAAADARRHVVVLDCGAKRNILRALAARHCRVTIAPYDSDADAVTALKPDGVLFSNGPGDPEPCESARRLAADLIARRVPLFGLCLGHQIIALALGAKTEKMKFGHHGANHPVRGEDGRVLITSQNHGFAVAAATLPAACARTHTSLFDGSLQGMRCDEPPLMTFQGHPEASPGPRDAGVLFDEFVALMDARRR